MLNVVTSELMICALKTLSPQAMSGSTNAISGISEAVLAQGSMQCIRCRGEGGRLREEEEWVID
jgi:hypothetical protein